MTSNASGTMDLPTIARETAALEQRLKDKAVLDYKQVFCAELLPLLRLLVQSVGTEVAQQTERLDLMEDVVAEYFQGEGSRIQPMLAARIQAMLALGMKLADGLEGAYRELAALAEEQGADGRAMPDELKQYLVNYREQYTPTAEMVAEVTLEDLELERPGGDEDEPSEDESDEYDDAGAHGA